MKINIKARLKNKTFLLTITTLLVTFVYQLLSMFDVVPKVSESTVINLFGMLVNLLAGLGVIVDPTTAGINDSARAMTYYTENDERETGEVNE